jgi:hypothetical protein
MGIALHIKIIDSYPTKEIRALLEHQFDLAHRLRSFVFGHTRIGDYIEYLPTVGVFWEDISHETPLFGQIRSVRKHMDCATDADETTLERKLDLGRCDGIRET